MHPALKNSPSTFIGATKFILHFSCIIVRISSFVFIVVNVVRLYLVPHFTQKKLGFGPSFYRMKLNTTQNFWQKVSILHFGFWPRETKKKIKKSSPTP
jgi:hypothetical protein